MKDKLIIISLILSSCNSVKMETPKEKWCGLVEYYASFAIACPQQYQDSCSKYAIMESIKTLKK